MIHEDVWRPNPCQVAIDPVNNYTRHQIACLSAFSSARPVPSVLTPTPLHPPRRDSLVRGREGKKKTLLSSLDGGFFFVGVRVEPFQPLHKNEPRSASPSAVSIPSPFPLFLPPTAIAHAADRSELGREGGNGTDSAARLPIVPLTNVYSVFGEVRK